MERTVDHRAVCRTSDLQLRRVEWRHLFGVEKVSGSKQKMASSSAGKRQRLLRERSGLKFRDVSEPLKKKTGSARKWAIARKEVRS